MTRMRIGLALSAAVLGLSGLVGLTAGGSVAAASAAQPTPSDTGAPSAPGPSAPDSTAPGGPAETPGANAPGEHHGMGLGNILHGEGTIKTKQGTKMVAMQHGTVTSVSDSTLTLKSSDGYTKKWSLAPSVHVIEHRHSLQPTSIKIGTDLVAAGPRNGTNYTANVIVVSPGEDGGNSASTS